MSAPKPIFPPSFYNSFDAYDKINSCPGLAASTTLRSILYLLIASRNSSVLCRNLAMGDQAMEKVARCGIVRLHAIDNFTEQAGFLGI